MIIIKKSFFNTIFVLLLICVCSSCEKIGIGKTTNQEKHCLIKRYTNTLNLPTIYFYQNGRISAIDYYAYKGILPVKYAFKYDEKGRVVERTAINTGHRPEKDLLVYEGDKLITKETYYTDNNTKALVISYFYTDNKLTKAITKYIMYKLADEVRTFRYDSRGNLIEIVVGNRIDYIAKSEAYDDKKNVWTDSKYHFSGTFSTNNNIGIGSSATYNEHGYLTRVNYANGKSETFEYEYCE